MNEIMIVFIVAVAAVVLTAIAMYFGGVRKWKNEAASKEVAVREMESRCIKAEAALENNQAVFDEKLKASQNLADQKINSLEEQIQQQKAAADKALADEKSRTEKMQEEMKENYRQILKEHDEAYEKQSNALKAEMVAKTEEILRQRQEELDKKAKETFENITGNLGKDFKEMKTAFEENKTKNTEDSASMKEMLKNAVDQMEKQTKSVGDKADHLAEALRGDKKAQGCWGETILQNLLDAEGLVAGRDYEKEETLRDELGLVLVNEDTDKKMRPDYILHFVDNQDVVIDSKVSLSSFAEYIEADTEASKKAAAERNLAAFKTQVKNLSTKKYSEYLKPGRRMVDYVIMFVPNYPALQLAYSSDRNLWRWAYEQKVLIASSETLMPFLRSIFLAWRNVEQVKNQQKIIASAQNMITRVAEFASSMQTLGTKLDDARKAFESADKKLKNSGQGILVSAHQVVNLGVPVKKTLPEPDYVAVPEELSQSNG